MFTYILLGVLTFAGVAMALGLKRMVASHQEKQALTAQDLQLLQETVETLIERLKTASDEAVAEMDRRQRKLEALMDRLDEKSMGLDGKGPSNYDLSRLSREGRDDLGPAPLAGMSRGEIELMQNLQAARR